MQNAVLWGCSFLALVLFVLSFTGNGTLLWGIPPVTILGFAVAGLGVLLTSATTLVREKCKKNLRGKSDNATLQS